MPEIDYTAQPGRVDITYHIEEVDPFEYLIGGGVNGVQSGTGNGQFIAKSLLGRGDMLRFNLDFGDRFQNFAVSYRDPSTLGHRLPRGHIVPNLLEMITKINSRLIPALLIFRKAPPINNPPKLPRNRRNNIPKHPQRIPNNRRQKRPRRIPDKWPPPRQHLVKK